MTHAAQFLQDIPDAQAIRRPTYGEGGLFPFQD
eukprot:CAMPEP_0185764352 /NCGR_PEP_ID=MMETSP1174-20130828/23283_1 /TAXON_ID=35687 /ORGANISM="Dictyocha speculum, Strain CCMP1381" /LENGTH=32 /DNA_ID= /DNA_START= /DNA_END= /DNA_ORIENTATION=